MQPVYKSSIIFIAACFAVMIFACCSKSKTTAFKDITGMYAGTYHSVETHSGGLFPNDYQIDTTIIYDTFIVKAVPGGPFSDSFQYFAKSGYSHIVSDLTFRFSSSNTYDLKYTGGWQYAGGWEIQIRYLPGKDSIFHSQSTNWSTVFSGVTTSTETFSGRKIK